MTPLKFVCLIRYWIYYHLRQKKNTNVSYLKSRVNCLKLKIISNKQQKRLIACEELLLLIWKFLQPTDSRGNGILKDDGKSSWILGHNVYSVVLFQLIGTILSAFVRLKKSYHYSHPCSQNASQVAYTPPLCTHPTRAPVEQVHFQMVGTLKV